MLKNILLFAMGIAFLASCNKECDSSTHKVGFYYVDSQPQNEEKSNYRLYVDNVYKGDLSAVSTTPSCGDKTLLYVTLDGRKHDVEVKNEKDEYVNSEYLQISNNKLRSGTGKNSNKIVGSGANGANCSSKTGDDCVTFGFFN
jgi:hypothetical protein